MKAAKPNTTTVSRPNCSQVAPSGSSTLRIRSQGEGDAVVSSISALLVPAFEIGGADFRVGEEVAAGAAERDLAVHHYVAPVRQAQRMVGVLLDEEDRDALRAVDVADDLENLLHDQRREAERRLVQQQQAR